MSPTTVLASLIDGVRIAIDAIRANVVRAGLTILGVAVGVFVVVVISAVIQGINANVARDFEAAGPTSFAIQSFPVGLESCDGSEDSCTWLHNPPITAAEVASLRRLPSVLAASAQTSTRALVTYRRKRLPGPQIEGDSPEWIQVAGGDVHPGRSFTIAENAGGAPVAVINSKMTDELFGDMDPIGKMIKIRSIPFRVIGVYHNPGSSIIGGDEPKAIVPFETVRRSLHGNYGDLTLTIKPRAYVRRDDAIDEAIVRLRELRGLEPRMGNNFAIVTQDQLFKIYNKTVGMFFLVMIGLSAVGLIVGGVGVVAIMMISVTERTREIGVRKALGATRWMILWQFLVEAVTLTGAGAAIGIVMGWVVSAGMRAATPIPANIPLWAIFAALVASAITGIAFGMVPALRAAQLDPVEALRYE